MKYFLFVFIYLFSNNTEAQIEDTRIESSHIRYLKYSAENLNKEAPLGLLDKRIIGFGALHGSSKTETAEIALINNISGASASMFYFPETDYSTAFYFQRYLDKDNDTLLKDLIIQYAIRVPQEGSIEMYKKWQEIRKTEPGKIKVLGIDKIASYKYSIMHLLELTAAGTSVYRDSLSLLLNNANTDFATYYPSSTKKLLGRLLVHIEQHRDLYPVATTDTLAFWHIIFNIKASFSSKGREEQIYRNYKKLSQAYNLKSEPQFFRWGIFHLMKSRINGNASFFTQLIEGGDYEAKDIFTIQGFLSDSKVLWETRYDEKGQYKSHRTKGGTGIADHWTEHYKGIRHLKKNRGSDLTYFELSVPTSPYHEPDVFELVKVRKFLGRSYWEPMPGKSTCSYIDACILILDSPASRPIELLWKK